MSSNQVASYVDVSQFEPGESAYECGFFQVALQVYAGKPGYPPTGTPEQVDELADRWYVEDDGLNTSNNKNGMSIWQLYNCLHRAGINFRRIVNPNVALVKGWVEHGYPALIACSETSIYDKELGDKVPYGWKPSGSHIICVSGISDSGDLLCHDTATIASTGLRPQPRTYDANKIEIITATAIILSWLPTPSTSFNPLEHSSPIEGEITKEYTIVRGDTLDSIASRHGVSLKLLLQLNQKVLDTVAREQGYPSSFEGNMIFPGTMIKW